MEKAVIVDIDGTLANCEHRRHFILKMPKDWKSFHVGCGQDTVNGWCRTIVLQFKRIGYKILLVSGRIAENRTVTMDWLYLNNIPHDRLLMRKPNDFRDDQIVKREIYEDEIKGKYEVLFAVDDRKRIVEMWREVGLVCLQCAEGDF